MYGKWCRIRVEVRTSEISRRVILFSSKRRFFRSKFPRDLDLGEARHHAVRGSVFSREKLGDAVSGWTREGSERMKYSRIFFFRDQDDRLRKRNASFAFSLQFRCERVAARTGLLVAREPTREVEIVFAGFAETRKEKETRWMDVFRHSRNARRDGANGTRANKRARTRGSPSKFFCP